MAKKLVRQNFAVTAQITIRLSIDINADSLEEAVTLAKSLDLNAWIKPQSDDVQDAAVRIVSAWENE